MTMTDFSRPLYPSEVEELDTVMLCNLLRSVECALSSIHDNYIDLSLWEHIPDISRDIRNLYVALDDEVLHRE